MALGGGEGVGRGAHPCSYAQWWKSSRDLCSIFTGKLSKGSKLSNGMSLRREPRSPAVPTSPLPASSRPSDREFSTPLLVYPHSPPRTKQCVLRKPHSR